MSIKSAVPEPGLVGQQSFRDAIRDFRAGTDSPRDYLERKLAVIDEREPVVRAWVATNVDNARKAADASTERWLRQAPLSPVDGMPIGVKDLLETVDMPTQMGCAAYDGNFPRHDNAAVWALREAGVLVLGKTVTAELGGTHPGPTTHPLDPTRTPGGSSSGSAAVVAAGMVPAAIGTQVAGSIIRPASYCANWALKPSQGAVNRGERQATSMSTHGTHAACPEDMWLLTMAMAARAGGDPGFPSLAGPMDTTPMAARPYSVGVMQTEGWNGVDAATRTAFDLVLAQLDRLGCPVLRRDNCSALDAFEDTLVGARDVALSITAWENHWRLRGVVAANPDGVSTRSKQTLRVADELGVDGYARLIARRSHIRLQHCALSGEAEVLISLGAPGPAPVWAGDIEGQPLAQWPTGDPVFNAPSSLLGAPVVTVPLMWVDGLPVGLQVMGQQGSDARVTAIAQWFADNMDPIRI
ncbi:amidase [Mycobacterium sp. 21AC1]|uniref:amidase n=1 Tax=[Mycobacterium] appelbergii TaxID=2939269 RepID=UPI002939195F|nr:amidase [Mycobacterium sp. 21AC1]MDV3129897.1 amidase [Mycobacterium sp. 21AC1]